MNNEEVTGSLITLAQAMAVQENREVRPRMNIVVSILTSRLRDFVRMNPPTFLVSKVGEDPQALLDDVYKILMLWE